MAPNDIAYDKRIAKTALCGLLYPAPSTAREVIQLIFTILCVTQWRALGLRDVIKRQFFTFILQFFYSIWFRTSLLNVIRTGRSPTSYWFSKMAATASQIYFRFRAGDISHFRRWKTICLPNFDKISLSMAELIHDSCSAISRGGSLWG